MTPNRTERRRLLALMAALASTAAVPAWAQTAGAGAAERQLGQDRFTLVAPFPPGGPVDVLARMLADGLQRKYGQAAIVENLPGAAGNIGIDRVKRARPDGHTLLVIPAGNLTINPTLMPSFPFNIEKDFAPVTMLAQAPNVLVANPGLKIKTAQELVALARAKPNTLAYASPGIGSGLHLAGELFKQQTGTDILHVPYKGSGPALNDVVAGQVGLMFTNLPASLAFIRSGKLVAIGTTEAKRVPAAPEIPTLAEQGIKGVVVSSWYGLLAPAGTPPAVVAQLARDAADILNEPAMRERLNGQGLSRTAMSPAEFRDHIRAETETWAKVIRARHIVAE
ncbi:Tripartite-type tricarboxylate transporter, receptor component TctC [Noviherbaspirillum humi]|uniref:Tripartite-type tricarboxylate transporter, receptor component TctC n=1 Tax=Noviherbaspirillum humi TaxID=1688639 RepID=A0A239I5W0_9BURK|nr:tripartite tricarboxylate transporter substrate binding protein [Noviherbaspirillum humi]SNS88752.1 Tripartite-type tricarboxylate transporter, receptor component TctC [Noviherbaspirillum humi]